MFDRPALVGATGFTGKLIASLLDREGVSFYAAGRKESVAALHGEFGDRATPIEFDVLNYSTLQPLLSSSRLIVNCVGPYDEYSRRFLQDLAREPDVVYLDVTGEQSFVDWSIDACDGPARACGTTIVHSVGFESAPADFLSALICDRGAEYDEIASFYETAGHTHVSPGTQLTKALSRHRPAWIFKDGRKEASPSMSRSRSGAFLGASRRAYGIPYPEICFFSRRYRTRNAESFFLIPDDVAESFLAFSKTPPSPIESLIERHRQRKRPGPSEVERRQQAFRVSTMATAADGSHRVATMEGSDPYLLTAAVVVEAIKRVRQGSSRPFGVCGPADVLPARETIESVAGYLTGLRVLLRSRGIRDTFEIAAQSGLILSATL
jgi:short subunit dehydrogenase-like uncharacterized protein